MVAIFDIEERGKAYGLLRSIGSLAGLVLMPAVGQLANVPDGWRYGMYLMGGLSLVSGLLLAIFLKEPPHRVVEDDPDAGKFKLSDVPKIFRIPTVPLLAIYLLLIGPLVKALGTLDRVMLFMVSVPYAVNAIYWFVFYGPYPKDVARVRAKLAGKQE